MENLAKLEYKAKLQADERLYLKGLKYKKALREHELKKLKFKTFEGSYREFLQAKHVIVNKIVELNNAMTYFLNLLIEGEQRHE